MARIKLSTLGPLQVICDGLATGLPYDKVSALLVYLALEAGHALTRDSLAELLWPNRPSAASRHNLSQALTALRQALNDRAAAQPLLIVNREQMQLNPDADCWLDVAEFKSLLDVVARHAHPAAEMCAECADRLEAAAALYQGDFLAGFSAGDGVGFEQWMLVKREALRDQAVRALDRLAHYRAAAGEFEAAVHHARRQLALDPWREPAYRQVMRFLACAGQRSAALAEYERCRHSLSVELGIEPEAETQALYELIRSGGAEALRDPPARPAPTPDRPAPIHNLPAQTTAFIGREPELQALAERCADPACRLITLVGPGGVGKTRLALQAAAGQMQAFRHGVRFVALASRSSPDLIPSALAEALDFTPYGADDLPAQLWRYLRDKHLLLVLDNFEHLLPGAALLVDILAGAPQVKLLVTSRERLNLHGEWAFTVEGLSLPAGDWPGDPDEYSAIRLFVQSARRAQSSFDLQAGNRADVARICRLVGGMPLGIELATAWLPVLSPAEIAHEIEQNLDFLAAELRDLPERHRSLRAVFDQSWGLIAEPERAAFRRLSVLRGGFTREAAEAVAGASLADLGRLAAKSLLRRAASGRYEVHELLHQYGARKLGERPAEEQQTRERHGNYYLTFLASREAALKGHGQQTALAEIASEMENIRAAWEWAAQLDKADLLASAIDAYWLFSEVLGRYSEAERQFRLAAAALERAPEGSNSRALALGKALACLGSWHMRLGAPEKLRALGARSLDLLRALNAQRELAFTLNMLAAAAHVQGAYVEEQRWLQESIGLGRAAGDRWITGYSLNDLGLAAFLLGNAPEARRLCTESLAVFRAIGDQRGMAFALNNLGLIAGQLGDPAEADRLLRESLALWRANGHRWGIATALTRLGAVARARRDHPTARACWLEAIQTGLEVRTLPPVLDALVELAALLQEEGDRTQARAIVRAVLHHPAGMAATRTKAERLLADLGDPPGAPGPDIETLAAALLAPPAASAPDGL